MKARKRRGFTLLEVMIALGLLALGGAMVLAPFIVTGVENKESVELTTGALAYENALAICRNKLRHSVLSGRVAVAEGQYTNVTGHITLAEAAYPMARVESETPAADWPEVKATDWVEVAGRYYPRSRYGWMVSARQMRNVDSPTRTVGGLFVCPICNAAYLTRELAIRCRDAHDVRLNDYELSIVVYQKFLPTDRPGHEIQLDPSCKKASYAPDGVTPGPADTTRTPTLRRGRRQVWDEENQIWIWVPVYAWGTRTPLRP